MKTHRLALLTLVSVLWLPHITMAQTWNWAAQVATYSSGGSFGTQVTKVTVDPSENVYITGDYGDSVLIGGQKLKGIPVGLDMYVARLNSSGSFAWAESFGSNDGNERVLDIVHDSAGHVYVCCYFTGQLVLDSIQLNSVSISNVAVAKYNSSGDVMWARLVWNAQSGPGALVHDHGFIYAAVNRTLIKFTADGDTVWTRPVPNTVSTPVEFSDAVADTAGNVYVTGLFTGMAQFGAFPLTASAITDVDIVILKYSPAGTVLWAKRAGAVSTPIQMDFGRGLAVSEDGDLYVVGQFTGKAFFEGDSVMAMNATSGMFIARYDQDGNLQWVKGGSGPNFTSSTAAEVRILPDDDVLVLGSFVTRVTVADTTINLGGGGDVLMLRLAPDGARRFAKRSDTFGVACSGKGLELSPSANFAYACGQMSNDVTFGPSTLVLAGGNSDGWIAKMTLNAVTGVSEADGVVRPDGASLSQNYPNPFNPETHIDYSMTQPGSVRLEIFNITGQKVRTLVDAIAQPGRHTATWDGTSDSGEHVASGLYFYRLRTSDFAQCRKLLLLK